jgi:hypothetical protein
MKDCISFICIVCIVGISGIKAGNLQLEYPIYAMTAESGQHVDSLDLEQKPAMANQKSVIRAGFYSLILPGAGEYYARSYWKAALFFGAEIASWTAYAVYTGKGNKADNDMKSFADMHWSEHRYWTKVYYTAVENGLWSGYPDLDQNGDHMIDDTYYTQEYIAILREMEGNPQMGYTHRLPETKTQQYYEMIYKYADQFGNAWDDALFDAIYNGYTDTLTPNMRTYRSMRNEMNDLYNNASVALNVVVINHVLSAIDAAWTARRFNRLITVSLQSDIRHYIYEPVQMFGIQIKW